MWLCVGVMLLTFAYSWLELESRTKIIFISEIGIVLALLIHHFGFLRIVNKNLKRLLPIEGKRSVFTFITWKSYLIIVVMVTMGATLRRSAIPKQYLAVLYIGIGLALILSSVRYIRFFIKELQSR